MVKFKIKINLTKGAKSNEKIRIKLKEKKKPPTKTTSPTTIGNVVTGRGSYDDFSDTIK